MYNFIVVGVIWKKSKNDEISQSRMDGSRTKEKVERSQKLKTCTESEIQKFSRNVRKIAEQYEWPENQGKSKKLKIIKNWIGCGELAGAFP